MFQRKTVKTKLIFWNAGVMMIILSLLSLGIYLFMKNSLAASTQSKLDGGFNTVETVLRNSGGDIMDLYHLGQDFIYAVRKGDKIIYLTRSWDNAAWTAGLNWDAFTPYGDVPLPHKRFLLRRGVVDEFGFEILYARDVTDAFDSLRSLLVILISAFPAALLMAVLGGNFLAGRALAPIKSITKKARQITAQNLNERLPIKNPYDEFGMLAETFNATLSRLDNSFDRLRRFTADASHELRTPLTAIRSVGEVALSSSVKDTSCREAIGSMLEETERLTNLVDSLLVLARADSRKIEMAFDQVNLSCLLAEVVDELRVLAEEKEQSLSLEDDSDAALTADRATLRQAFSNVIHNAIRYTQKGGRIRISIRTENGKASVFVDDNGPGIPIEKRAKVFERFYRLDRARSRLDGGTGLGLSIAQWAVEANGGTIKFCEKEGQGSLCCIKFATD